MEVEKTIQVLDDTIVTIISLGECLVDTEGAGFYKKGAVKKLLESEQIVFTPFASYKKRKGEKNENKSHDDSRQQGKSLL